MDRRKLGAVLGGVFGGLFLICASAFFICFCCACRKNSQGVTSTAGYVVYIILFKLYA